MAPSRSCSGLHMCTTRTPLSRGYIYCRNFYPFRHTIYSNYIHTNEYLSYGLTFSRYRFVPVRNDELLSLVLRTLHNLSFDRRLRDQMVDGGLIAKAVDILPEPQFQPVVLGLLYHVSMEDR